MLLPTPGKLAQPLLFKLPRPVSPAAHLDVAVQQLRSVHVLERPEQLVHDVLLVDVLRSSQPEAAYYDGGAGTLRAAAASPGPARKY